LEQKHLDNTGRRSEAEWQQSEGFYRQIVETATEGVWVFDADANTSYVNRRMAEMLGCTKSEMMGRPIYDFMDEGVRAEVEQALGRNNQTGREQSDLCFRRKDGSELWTIVTLSPMFDERGKFSGTMGMVTDITQRRQAEAVHQQLEAQLFQAQKMESIGVLAGGVAHDFNNLLTAILGNSQLMHRRLQGDQERLELLSDIEAAARRATALTQQLLTLSRRQHLKRSTIYLNELAGNCMRMLRRIIGEDIDVRFHTTSRPFPVFVDPVQIEQVIMNLAINARDAMPLGGQLIIETSNITLDETFCRIHPWARPGRFVQLSVSDTGSGMSEETQQHIFEPFFTTKGPGNGTGLGLSVVYGIVRQHDALIHVYSEVGHGSAFKIFFPVAEQKVVTEPPKSEDELRGGTETILIAEDDEALCKITRNILGKLGYEILVARTGREAVDIVAARAGRVDLLILDVIMPRLGGPDAYEQIRRMNVECPAIFMTGYGSERARSMNEKLADAVILEKPYLIDTIGRRVREVLDQEARNRNLVKQQ